MYTYLFYSPADCIEVVANNPRIAWREARRRAHAPNELELVDVWSNV